MARKRFYIVAFSILALSAGVAAGSVFLDQKVPATSYSFETAAVGQGEVRKVVATSGTVRPRMTVQIGSELSGRIRSIAADFNARVNAGDLLAVIDPKTFESKAAQAKADLLSADAALANSEAAVRKARAVLTNAEKVRTRQGELGRKGITSAAIVDNSERDLNVARAEVEVAEASVANARAVVAQKKAQLDQALIDLDRTRIRSPIEGIVLHRAVDVGQTVAASFQAPELFRIAGDLTKIHIEAQVSEADIGSIRQGNPVVFDVDSYPGRQFTGRIDQIRLAPAVADSVVTYMVIIEADNERIELFPGMTANVRIEAARRESVLRVALDAIRFEPPRTERSGSSATPSGMERLSTSLSSLLKGHFNLRSTEGESRTAAKTPLQKEARNLNDVVDRWARRLKLDEQQVAELRKRASSIETESAQATGQTGPAKRTGRRARTEESRGTRLEAAIEPLLNPEQRARLQKYRDERASSRSAAVWVLSPEGVPERRPVRVGLTDIRFAELVGSDLKPGDQVIVRSRKVKVQ
jgi:HlyD family secretion protein